MEHQNAPCDCHCCQTEHDEEAAGALMSPAPALENGAPWLKAGDKIEVLTPVGWVEVEIRCLTDDPVKYPGYAHFDFGPIMHGCVSPYFYGTTWRLPAGRAPMAVGL